MTNTLIYIARTCTPTHVGCGQGLDDIDLPVQRGTVSELPLWPGSSLKGVLRHHAKHDWQWGRELVEQRFGPERENAAAHAGMLNPQDAQLLALPVASLCGGWAWVTSHETLRRFQREACATVGGDWPELPPRPAPSATSAAVADTACVATGSPLPLPKQDPSWLTLAELALLVDKKPLAADLCLKWGKTLAALTYPGEDDKEWRQQVALRLVLVNEDAFAHLARMATEVRSRVSLDENRVAADSSLWREECLPADTLMWGAVSADPAAYQPTAAQVSPKAEAQWRANEAQQALAALPACTIQIGGKASVGYGFVQFMPIRDQGGQHAGA